jgi:DNA polymerase-3 subunit alpha
MSQPFAHLNVHSHFSLLDAIPSPAELAKRAAELGMRHLALTDNRALYAAVPFQQHAEKAHIKPIFGASLAIPELGSISLLVRNSEGYRNLSALLSTAHRRGGHLGFQLNERDLMNRRQGLLILSGGQRGILWQLVKKRNLDAASALCRRYKNIFGRDFVIEIQHFQAADRLYNLRLRDLAHSIGLPLVASNDVRFIHAHEQPLHHTLRAIAASTMLERLPASSLSEQYLKSAAQMWQTLNYIPEALTYSIEIAERCNFRFQLGAPRFAKVPLPEGKSARQVLRQAALNGARQRYTRFSPALRRRLRYELRVIEDMGFVDYFLIVRDIVTFCHRENIPCVGRGSAGDSLISYLLGITQVDPLAYNLYFERFLNRERHDPPDIDLDIDWLRRDIVLNYVYERFGHDKTAMICTFATFQLRSSIRDVAKAFGFPAEEIETMLRFLPRFGIRELALAVDKIPHCSYLKANVPLLQEVLSQAERLSDFPRHLSIHAGGIVIAPQKLTDFVPLEVAAKGLLITQFDMYSIEPLGLVKMDLLGVRSLSVISETTRQLQDVFSHRRPLPLRAIIQAPVSPTEVAPLTLFSENNPTTPGTSPPDGVRHFRLDIGKRRIRPVAEPDFFSSRRFPFLDRINNPYSVLDTRSLPTGDHAVTQMLRQGLSMGCFQLESPGMRSLLAKMQISGVDDVIVAVALIRPGAADSGMKDVYIRRRAGLDPVAYPTPALQPILRDTYGVIIYQEQVMQIAAEIARFSLAQGEYLRRAMTKFKQKKKILAIRQHFVEGVVAAGHSTAVADEIWKFLKNFVGYGFNKAHAAIYGVLAYQSAYLKYYFPVPFMTAVLNNEGGFYHTAAYIEECRRLGIAILPPDVNTSEVDFTWYNDTIRCGFRHVYDLTNVTLAKIVSERRRRGLYRDLYDFIRRVRPRRGEVENLIKIGALATFSASQPQLLLQSQLYFKHNFRQNRMAFSASHQLPPYTSQQRLRHEIDILGFAVSAHPLSLFRDQTARINAHPSLVLGGYRDRDVVIIGWRITSRRLRTKTDEYMQFLTLEDEHGLMEVILFPEVFKRCGSELQGPGPFLVHGYVQSRMPGEVNVIARDLRRLR